MAKTDKTSTITNRNQISIANSILKDPVSDVPTIAIDIAMTGANWTRSSVQTDLDAAESAAQALALSSGKPTRVTLNGAEYLVYTRGNG